MVWYGMVKYSIVRYGMILYGNSRIGFGRLRNRNRLLITENNKAEENSSRRYRSNV